MQRIEIVPGYNISRIIKGGWQLAENHQATQVHEEQALRDMHAFVSAGITTFDCADIYRGVEDLIGRFREQSPEARVQVHTKFVPGRRLLGHLDRALIEEHINTSLTRLKLERIDLIQLHWWDFDIPGYIEAMGCLADLQKAGKIRHLGVTNFDVPHLREITNAGIRVVSNQVQYSLLDRRPEHGMVDFCRDNDTHLLCYGTLAGGFISERWLGKPEPIGPMANRSLAKYKLIIDEFGGWERFQELLRAIRDIVHSCNRDHAIGFAEVAMRYVLNKSRVAGIIVGARSAEHLYQLQRVLRWNLTEAESELLDTVLVRANDLTGDCYSLERIRGGRHEAINLNTQLTT